MIKHLITGGCSFSAGKEHSGWTKQITEKYKSINPNLTFEHTGFYSQGQELIQKKVMLAISEALDKGADPEEILAVVMWSGTHRKAWFINNPDIIKEITVGMKSFHGGMSSQFLDLKNEFTHQPEYFYTMNGSKFPYNPEGGWYFTVDGSECKMGFVQEHYLLDRGHSGLSKIHTSLENIVTLTNFCKLNKVKLVHQFFMDIPYQDIENNKNHQIINYLYKQLDFNNTILNGMFDYLHTYIGVSREKSRFITHDERKKRDNNQDYFSSDGFHPGEYGAKIYCENVLFPNLERMGLL